MYIVHAFTEHGIVNNVHSFIKSWFFGLQQFSFNFILKIIINNKNNLFFFTKGCHLFSDKLEAMEI